jgi:hypothetical protein
MKRLALVISLFSASITLAQTAQWNPGTASDWYARQPWIVGANYIQSNTVNQIEMWQADTFDGDRIDMELGWAERLGINTLRVSLAEVVWEHDSGGMQSRMGKLLKIADKHKMRVIFVLFDSSGDPYPEWGHQRQPKPGVRNSLWVQSPGAKGLTDPKQVEQALSYAEDLVAAGTSGMNPTTSMRPATPIPNCRINWKSSGTCYPRYFSMCAPECPPSP